MGHPSVALKSPQSPFMIRVLVAVERLRVRGGSLKVMPQIFESDIEVSPRLLTFRADVLQKLRELSFRLETKLSELASGHGFLCVRHEASVAHPRGSGQCGPTDYGRIARWRAIAPLTACAGCA